MNIVGPLLIAGSAVFISAMVILGYRALEKPYVAGAEGIVGEQATALTDLKPKGKVWADGGVWNAVCEDGTANKDEELVVTGIKRLTLTVRRID